MKAALINMFFSIAFGVGIWIATDNQTASILSGVIVYCSATIVKAIDDLKNKRG